jgi:hypothetical protein
MFESCRAHGGDPCKAHSFPTSGSSGSGTACPTSALNVAREGRKHARAFECVASLLKAHRSWHLMSRCVVTVVSTVLLALICAGGSNASLEVNRSVAASIEVVANRGVVGFGYDQGPDDPAPARIAVHVPDKFTFTPNAKGAPIGSVVGFDVFVLRADARQPLTGVLTIADPATFAAEGKACTGASSHDAVWAASVQDPDLPAAQIPLFVDGRTFTICPDPALLGGTPIGIGLQLGLVSNSGIDRPLVTAPSTAGRFIWSATVTRLGVPEAELRSIVELPQRATFRARAVHGSVRITGRVLADGQGVGSVRLEASVTGNGRGFTVTGYSRADGRFTLSHRLGRGTFAVRVNSEPEDRNVTAQVCAGGACTSATEMILGLQAAPGTIRVRSTGAR